PQARSECGARRSSLTLPRAIEQKLGSAADVGADAGGESQREERWDHADEAEVERELGFVMDLVLDEVPEPSAQGPVDGDVGNLHVIVEAGGVECVQSLQGDDASLVENSTERFLG